VVVMASHIKDDPPPLAEVSPNAYVPPSVEAVVRRALAKSPEHRQQSAEALVNELDIALAQSSVQGTGLHATTWVGPSQGRRNGSRAALAVAGAAVLGSLTVAAFVLVREAGHPADPPTAHAAPAAPPSVDAPREAPAPSASEEPAPSASPVSAADAGTVRRAPRRSAPTPVAPPPLPPAKAEGYGKFE